MSPEGYIRLYFERRDNHGASSVTLVDSTGRTFAKKCAKCGKKKRSFNSAGDPVCASQSCRTDDAPTPWPYVDAFLLRGVVQSSMRHDHFERKIGSFMDIARELHRFVEEWGPRAKVFIAHAHFYSRKAIVDAAPWPDFKYTDWNVRQTIKDARAEWAKRLNRIGIDTDI